MKWSFFDSNTGMFLSRRFTGSEKAAKANTPAGATAISGHFDRLSQRVDLETGHVIDYQPPKPTADHEWNPERRRWEKKLVVVEAEMRDSAARRRMAELELSQQRAMREHLLGDASAVLRLAAIDAEIQALRADLIRT